MDQIVDWLKRLGMSEYAQRFAENGIGIAALRHLTDQDLKEIGVLLGHRRIMLAAIAELPRAAEPVAQPVVGSEPRPRDGAERRQVTVVLCDLVGSTALSARMDPEDLREVISAYQNCVAETVRRFGGFVAKYMGDGVLSYFGYPQAHEDDAERAVRAGLEAIATVGGLKSSVPLRTRVGIATGLVVVGDLIGSGEAQERGIIGETPNLAARLQGIAEPNAVVIAESTRRLLGDLFELEDLGRKDLKGIAGPVPVWAALRPSSAESRFDALHGSQLTALVGREEELGLLRRNWDQARSGDGRVVLVGGEPGIGKSRLTAAIAERLADEPHTRLRYFCSPYHQDSALYPFIAQLERTAGFARDDTAEEKRAKLEALLAPGTRDMTDLTLIAELLSLPNGAAELNLSPQRKREMLFDALLRQLEAVSRAQSTLMVFEDAHWIDPTSRELLDLTVERVSRLPVLLVVTFRPEFRPGWDGQPHVTMLALNRLGVREVTALVAALARNAPLGIEVVSEIVERTDGVPLFVEELTKAVLERADQDQGVAAVLSASPMPALAVPPTLHASLIARLDRLGGPAKAVAQVGAALGREFTYELIASVAQRPESELKAALALLTEAGLLFCRGVPPHASYMFKHALVQDAAYAMLLRVRRQELHARAADVLEHDFADLIERQPELLAHHFTAAGNNQRAVDQWLKAGQHAASRMAHVEALGHLDRGLALLLSLPDGPVRDGQEIELQLALGTSSITVNGMSAPRVGESYARAHELARKHGDQRQEFQALYGLWQHNSGSGRIVASRPLSERLLQVTEHASDSGLRLQAHHSAWTTGMLGGDPARGYQHTEAGIRIYDPEEHRSHRHVYGGHDPGVCALMTGALLEWLLGYPDRALISVGKAQALGERISHPFSMELAVTYAAMVHLNRGEPELAAARIAVAEAIATEQRVSFFIEPLFLRGAVLVQQGAVAEAIAAIREGLARSAPAAKIWQSYPRCFIAEAFAREGNYQEAHSAVTHALDGIGSTGERMWQSEAHRVRGLLLLGENKPAESEAAFLQALDLARQQQAKSLELRAATSLARLWGTQGRRAEAQELLAQVYGWFTEGFDTRDLKEAKTLLNELT
jgi:class 3 adenylate cyclase/predicted ATPase